MRLINIVDPEGLANYVYIRSGVSLEDLWANFTEQTKETSFTKWLIKENDAEPYKDEDVPTFYESTGKWKT